MRSSSPLNWLSVIGLSLVSPAALALAPVIWLLKREADGRAAQLDWRTGLNRREHAIFNPGIPFELHPPKLTTFTAHPSYKK